MNNAPLAPYIIITFIFILMYYTTALIYNWVKGYENAYEMNEKVFNITYIGVSLLTMIITTYLLYF